MKVFEESQKNTHVQGGTQGVDSEEENDDDEGPEGQRVGC